MIPASDPRVKPEEDERRAKAIPSDHIVIHTESVHFGAMTHQAPESEVIFEFRRVGNVVKVSAVHVATDTEISIVGDPAYGEHGLKLAALRKLNYVLAQRRT